VGALVLHVLPFAFRPALIDGDERHYALMARSLAIDRDADLENDYAAVEAGSAAAGAKAAGKPIARHLRQVNGRVTFTHPLGLPLLAAPIVALQQAIAPGGAPDVPLGLLTLAVTFAALVAGWNLLARWTGSEEEASLLVFAVYFATPVWYYSRTFFTEPYTWAFAVLAVGAIVSGRLAVASILLAVTLAMKEPALLIVLPILAATAMLRGVRPAALLSIGPALFGIAFAIKNSLLVGTPFSTFQAFDRGDPAQAAFGLLLDPSRGLVFFAPIALVALAAFLPAARVATGRRDGVLLAASGAIFLSYFALTAAWRDWGGGSGYGPRLLVPALPALAIPLAYVLRRRPWSTAVSVASFAGFAVHWCAATYPVKAFWGASWRELLLLSPGNGVTGALVGAALLGATRSCASRRPRIPPARSRRPG
jgi:hypothetical protein